MLQANNNEWNERVQTGDPSPTPENARSVTGANYRLNGFLLTRFISFIVMNSNVGLDYSIKNGLILMWNKNV